MNGGHYLCPQMVWMLTHLIKAVSDHQPVFCGFYFSDQASGHISVHSFYDVVVR